MFQETIVLGWACRKAFRCSPHDIFRCEGMMFVPDQAGLLPPACELIVWYPGSPTRISAWYPCYICFRAVVCSLSSECRYCRGAYACQRCRCRNGRISYGSIPNVYPRPSRTTIVGCSGYEPLYCTLRMVITEVCKVCDGAAMRLIYIMAEWSNHVTTVKSRIFW